MANTPKDKVAKGHTRKALAIREIQERLKDTSTPIRSLKFCNPDDPLDPHAIDFIEIFAWPSLLLAEMG